MIPRILPILNALGCLAMLVLVVVQWGRERDTGRRLDDANRSLAISRGETSAAQTRIRLLENDIAALKESVEATQKSAESTARELTESSVAAGNLRTELDAMRARVVEWETAVKQRDERIRELNRDLEATRKRLQEAIDRIKAASRKSEER